MFEISDAGRYMLEIAPFEKKTGDYSLELKIVEPLASDNEKRVDQLIIAYSGEDVPGGVVDVIRDGQLVFSEAYGMVHLSHGIPYAVNTPSNIGSVYKQFTAMAILLLEQQGKRIYGCKRTHQRNQLRQAPGLCPETGILISDSVVNILTMSFFTMHKFKYPTHAFSSIIAIILGTSGAESEFAISIPNVKREIRQNVPEKVIKKYDKEKKRISTSDFPLTQKLNLNFKASYLHQV